MSRVYKTSGLLGFYGSQLKNTSSRDRFGLDSLIAESIKATSEYIASDSDVDGTE